MAIDLKVPFSEKESAKSLGARWDADRKTWYAPDGVDLAGFARWIPAPSPAEGDAQDHLVWRTVQSGRFMLVQSFTSCWKCGQRTEVFALMLPPQHGVIDRTTGSRGVTVREYIGESPEALTYTQKISDEAALYLTSAAPAFRKDFSKTTESIYWANHCAGCDALIGDFGQHYEPGGAFAGLWGMDFSGSEPITILPVHIPIECSFRIDVNAAPAGNGQEAEPTGTAAAKIPPPAAEWLDDPSTVFLDTETTGLDASAEIVEISIIDRTGHVLLDTMVRPVAPIPMDASRIHGITDEMVIDAPSWPELVGLVSETLRGRRVVIYNAKYDLRLMRQASTLAGVDPSWVDALRSECAMSAYSEHVGEVNPKTGAFRWHKLTDAATRCGVQSDGAHRALADCFMTLGVLQHMAGQS